MKRKLKKIPDFKSEREEREFWETNDTTEYVDWDKAHFALLPNLKPSLKPISLRLPEWMLDSIKVEANKNDIPYQVLIKKWLSEKLKETRYL